MRSPAPPGSSVPTSPAVARPTIGQKALTLFVATRPWSLPASVMPILLTAAVLFHLRLISTQAILCSNFVLCFVVTVSLHLAANCSNTYYDFVNGVDGPMSDDRTLVDHVLAPSAVLGLSLALYAVALGAMAYLFLAGASAVIVGSMLFGLALGFCYTAGPIRLKYVGFGDLTIFLAFGPALMLAVQKVLLLPTPTSTTPDKMSYYLYDGVGLVLLYSVPMGLLAEAILHANNTRDISADRKAGIVTPALVLGSPSRNFAVYVVCFLVSYGVPLTLSVATGNATLAIVGLALPVAASLLSAFYQERFALLPQRTAQHHLLFSALLVLALLLSSSSSSS